MLMDVDFEFCCQDSDVDPVWLGIKPTFVDGVNKSKFTPKLRIQSYPSSKIMIYI